MSHSTRVLLVTDAVGGVWIYTLELARSLRAFGVEAIVAVTGPTPSASQREDARDFHLIDTGLPLDWLATSPGELRRAGGTVAELATREGADVVQTSSAALLASSDFDQPCVAVQHSCVASWWAAVKGTALPSDFHWRRELVECGLNRASSIVAPSVAFAAETSRTYDLRTPVLAVHNGRRPVASSGLPQSDFVLTVSRLWDEGKNVATLDRAAAGLTAPFQAVGQMVGPNGASIDLQHLKSIGEVSPARLGNLLAARPVFVSAAVYEPFGLSVLEAAASGCALVLSDIPTHRELWSGAATFVAAQDDAAFAQAIQHLLDDPRERDRLGSAARAQAGRYSPARMASEMAGIYTRLTAAAPARMAGAA